MSPVINATDKTTPDLLGAMLAQFNAGESTVLVLARAGDGKPLEARLRVMITRKRAKVVQMGKLMRRFTLRAEHFPWTQHGIRYDCIKFTYVVTGAQQATMLLESMIHDR